MNLFNIFNKKPTPAVEQPIVKEPIVIGDPNALLTSTSFAGDLQVNSSTWIFIENHINQRLNDLRIRNDNSTYDINKTQLIRGQIKELKLLLSLKNKDYTHNNNNVLLRDYKTGYSKD